MREKIIESLKQVIYPNFEKDIVTFGFLSHIDVKSDMAYLKITIPSSNEEVIQTIHADIIEKTKHLGLAKIDIDIISPNTTKRQKESTIQNLVPSVKHFVMVSSGKGGVGKSTTSANLAISLAKSGKNVGLLDADIYGPNIPRMLGIDSIKPEVSPDGKKLIPLEKYGIKIMSIGLLYTKQSLVWRGPIVMRAIMQLLQDVLWGDLDILVIDMPPGTGDAQLTIAQSVPIGAGINVTTPQMVALDDGFRALDMFVKCNIPIFGIVENMSGFRCPDCDKIYDIFGSGNTESLAQQFNTNIVAKIPLEPKIVESSDSGKPMSFYNPDSYTSKMYMQCAAQLIDFLDTIKPDNSSIQPIQE